MLSRGAHVRRRCGSGRGRRTTLLVVLALSYSNQSG